MKDEMDGKVVFSRQRPQANFEILKVQVLFPICTLTWRVNNYVSRQNKGKKKRKRSKKRPMFLLFCNIDDNTQYYEFPTFYYWKLLKNPV